VAASLSLSLNAALPIVLLLWFVREAFMVSNAIPYWKAVRSDGSKLGKTPALANDGRFLIGTTRADEVID
jgi:hypothetical protein